MNNPFQTIDSKLNHLTGLVLDLKEDSKTNKSSLKENLKEEYLTRQETADMCKVTIETVWAWTKKGKLKAYGIGNRVLYKRSEVEAAIEPLTQIK